MQREKSLVYKGKRHLPLPSGPYSVGCSDVMTSYLKFGIFVRLYYPSKERGILERYLQWPQWIPHKQYINGYAERVGVPAYIYRRLHRVLVGDLYIPVILNAEIKPSSSKYPVIVFSHGLSGWRCTYSAVCLELASRGFVVAALEHRDHSASASFYKKQTRMSAVGAKPASNLSKMDDFQNFCQHFESEDSIDTKWSPSYHFQELGPFCQTKEWMLYQTPSKENEMTLRIQQLKFRARECRETIDFLENLNLGRPVSNVLNVNFNSLMFKDKLDLSKCFFIGHSFGGATGISSLATETRFRGGVFLDPWMFPFMDDQNCFSEISQPFVCILIKSFQTKESLGILKKLQSANKSSDFIALKKAQHRDVSDAPFVPKFSFSLSTKLGMRLERFSALDITIDVILQFLGEQIGGCWQPGSSKLETLKQRFLSVEDFTDLEIE